MNKTSFKKLTSIVLAVLMILSTFMVGTITANADDTSSVYLKPNSNWKIDGARFAIYVFNDSTGQNAWASMSADSTSGVYKATIPSGSWPNIIFCRMNPATTENNWDNKWNQTADLTLTGNEGKGYVVTEGTWDKGGGSWVSYSDLGGSTPDPGSNGNYYIVGSMNGWTVNEAYKLTANAEAEGEYYFFDLSVDAGAEMKVVYSADGASATTWYPDWGDNYVFTSAGKYNIYFRPDGQGAQDWFNGYFYVQTQSTPTEYTEPTEYTYPTTPTTPTQPTQQTQPTQPTASTAPIVTEPASISSPTDPTAADEDTNLYVSAKSNVNTVGSKVKVNDNDISVTYTLKTSEKIDDGQVSVSYDATRLSLSPVYNTTSSMFPVVTDAFYNLNAATGVIVFNFSGANGKYDFTQDNQVLVNLVFTKKSPSTVGTATVFMNISELYSKDTKYVDDNVINTGASMSVGQTVEGITPTVPTETEASTAAENDITINASSNLSATAQTQHATSANVKVTYKLTAPELISYGDATVTYDSTKLALESKYNTSETMFTTLNSNVSYRLNVANGIMKFNFTSVSSATHQGTYDFRTGGDVITLMFTVKAGATDTANVNLNFEQLGSIDTKYVENGAVVSAGAATSAEVTADSTATTSNTEATTASIATAESTTGTQPKPTEPTQSTQTTEGTQATEPTQSTQTTEGTQATEPTQSTQTTEATQSTQTTEATQATQSTQATQPTQSTQATQPQTQTPTQAYQTYITASADKKTIYVGATTRIYYSITNPVGATTFKSSNTKVATVTSAGKVTGKKAGTVTISVKNNGKVATVKITVIKKTNPITVKGKTITIKIGKKAKKLSKNHKYARTKAITIKNAKGTVVYKKVKGNKKITVTSKGVVTVKKGLKKGTYKVRVKVTAKGNTTYKARDRYVYFTVKIKK